MNITDFLLSVVYTVVVVLLPYIITRLITKRNITIKKTKILTTIFSIITFIIFAVIGFLSGQNGVSVLPVVIWNTIGYFIIKPNALPTEAKSKPIETSVDENIKIKEEITETANLPAAEINTEKSNKIKVTIKTPINHKEEEPKKPKRKLSTIILSITTAIFATSTIVLSVFLANATTEINTANSKIIDLEIAVKQKEGENRHLREENKYLNDDNDRLAERNRDLESSKYNYIYQSEEQMFNWDEIIENAN